MSAIAAGKNFSLALKSDGTVWAWGYNNDGELGNSSTINQLTPVLIKNFGSVKSIVAGFHHSMAIKQDGIAWSWGYNGYGQLGNGTTSNRTYPEQIASLSSIQAISGGEHMTLAYGNNGILYAFGRNDTGQLGNGTTMDTNAPQKVIGPNLNPADVTAPTTISDFRLTALRVRSADLAWSKAADDVGVSGYEISNGSVWVGTTGPTSTSITINNLALNTSYSFTIKAKDAAGNRAAASNPVTAATSDKTPPSVPKDLTLLGLSNSAVTLTWTGSTDNDVVKQYNIYSGTARVGSTASNSFTVTGLLSKTAYSFTVKAEDDAGNESASSTPLSVTTE